MASPEYERFTQMIRNSPKMVEMPLEKQRAAGEHAEDFTAAPEGITYETVDADGVRAVWATPENAAGDRALLYLFGGGYVISSPHSRRKFSGHLARAAGCPVLVPGYRLAPEHPFPAAIDDSTTAYRWLLRQRDLSRGRPRRRRDRPVAADTPGDPAHVRGAGYRTVRTSSSQSNAR